MRPLLPALVAALVAGCATTRNTEMRPSEALELAVTVVDLPRHGPDVVGWSRGAIHRALLAAFARHGVPGVVGFVNGASTVAHPEERAALEAWVQAGHPLANHTWSHADLRAIGVQAYLAEIANNEPLLAGLGTPNGGRLFRYPFAREGLDEASRAQIRDYLRAKGYRVAPATVDFEDWAWNVAYPRCRGLGDERALSALAALYLERADQALSWSASAARKLFGRPIKQILVLHAGAFDAEMIEALLARYAARGVRFIRAEEALSDPVYAEELHGAAGLRESSLLVQIAAARGVELPPAPAPVSPELDAFCRRDG